MILSQRRWEQVLHWFSDEEKLDIHKAVVGQPAMQKGFVIDEAQLAPELRLKVQFHFSRGAVTSFQAKAAS